MSGKQPRPGTKAYRERIIEAILDTPAGIYGAEVCQHCGEVATFRGYWVAVFFHFGPEFICSRCVRRYKREPGRARCYISPPTPRQ